MAKTKSKRGGQPGNKNALKHGFYSELLTKEEIARLNKVADINLDDEIKILRALVYRLIEQIETTDMDEARKSANTISNIVQVINTTQRTKLLARGGGGEIAQTILEAIMSLDPYKEL
jgi:uncharacterized protein YjcR